MSGMLKLKYLNHLYSQIDAGSFKVNKIVAKRGSGLKLCYSGKRL